MTIYLDTTAIPAHAPVDSIELAALRAVAEERGHQVALPRLVVDESVAQRWRHVEQCKNKLFIAQRAVRDFWHVDLPGAPSSDMVAAKWRSELEERYLVVEAPEGAAESALDREVRRVPPTREGRGARDAVIWLTVLHHLQSHDQESFFVSKNTKDFADAEDGTLLHPALRAELGETRLRYKRDVDELIDVLAAKIALDVTVENLASWPGTADAVASEFARAGFPRLASANHADMREDILGSRAVGDPYLATTVECNPTDVSSVTAYRVEDRKIAVVWSEWELAFEAGTLRKHTGGGITAHTAQVRATAKAQVWIRIEPDGSVEAEVAAMPRVGLVSSNHKERV